MVVQILGPYLWPLFLLALVVGIPLLILMWIGDAISRACERRKAAYASTKPVYVARITQGDSKRSAVVMGTVMVCGMIALLALAWINRNPPTPAQIVHDAFTQFQGVK
jgi:hypothetical protein